MGLPLCLSLVGSYLQRPIPGNQLALGEVDLCRNVRDLPVPVLEQVEAAIRAGELGAKAKLLCPASATSRLPWNAGIELVACKTLDDAIVQTWPDLK
jgi:predicted ATP-dependent serine protease